jgi:ComF family protein
VKSWSNALRRASGSATGASILALIDAALSLIYPAVCQVCGAARADASESFVCSGCRSSIRFIKPPFCDRCGLPFPGSLTTRFECSNCRDVDLAFSRARSVVVARDAILEVIHRYKYQRALWFEPFLARLLVNCAAPDLAKAKWNWIVPVPLHATKQREREFNQAERLARHLSRATNIDLNTRLLRRTLPTRTQTLLSRAERLKNVRQAFSLRKSVALKGERIVLVDDVFTTGATTGACARVLRARGAGEVCVWTLARGI